MTPHLGSGRAWSAWFYWVALIAVFGVAFAARLVPLLRGAGLYSLGNYDDGVHFAAGMGLIHGMIPYRDFLLLHPPGIVLILAPFAALSYVISEPDAMAVARLSWMALGGLNAILIALVLRPVGRVAAVIAALLYAVFFPAIYVEHTALLEPPMTAVMLAALVITRALGDGEGIRTRHYAVAGLLLGVSPAIKVWGVVVVLTVAGGLAYRRGLRHGMTVLVGAVASCTALCLPFFLSAPQAMWQMVVLDQLGRPRVDFRGVRRVDDVLGIMLWTDPARLHAGTAAGLLLLGAACIVCLARRELRLLAALLIVHALLLVAAPIWFRHYSGFTAAPIVLVLGAGLATLLAWAGSARPWLRPAFAGAATLAVLGSAIPLAELRLGQTFHGRAAAAVVANVPGCVVTDMPMTLIQIDVLRRNLERGCRLEVDLGGASYHLESGPYKDGRRADNPVWQEYALNYLRSGDAAVIARFYAGSGFSHRTARIVRSWPEIGRAGRYPIREPQPPASG